MSASLVQTYIGRVEGGVEIEILEVHGGKPGILLGQNTVDEQFYKFNQARGIPTSLGYAMLLPSMVMHVWSASSLLDSGKRGDCVQRS